MYLRKIALVFHVNISKSLRWGTVLLQHSFVKLSSDSLISLDYFSLRDAEHFFPAFHIYLLRSKTTTYTKSTVILTQPSTLSRKYFHAIFLERNRLFILLYIMDLCVYVPINTILGKSLLSCAVPESLTPLATRKLRCICTFTFSPSYVAVFDFPRNQ